MTEVLSVNHDGELSALWRAHEILNKQNLYELKSTGDAIINSDKEFYRDFVDKNLDDNLSEILAEAYNIGLDLCNYGYYLESIDCAKLFLKKVPGFALTNFLAASALLSLNNYELGSQFITVWSEYSRCESNIKIPAWMGEDLSNSSIYIIFDHGFGDIFQFVRYLPRLVKLCPRVYVGIPPELRRILGAFPGAIVVNEIPAVDYICSIYALPHVIGIDLATIGQDVPYIFPEATLVSKWRKKLPKQGFRVGVNWRGNSSPGTREQGRSFPLSIFAIFAAIPGVVLVSLQMGQQDANLDGAPPSLAIVSLGSEFNAGPDNFVDTAAVMASLDLIITCDTSVAHLAGACGFPVWVMLRDHPDWRWMAAADSSPWYPGMRIYRQSTRGDWHGVAERAASELRPIVERHVARLASIGQDSLGHPNGP